ncbi:DEAD/DEAH box helicase family protein [Pseudomonas putida]|uniref:DEAD/DEAH box helicase family protein n=1 Tax=Pseudomonas putida TaxID=303 RepID=UPI0018AC304E|nr:DEAD/DEAH box helicase family protein [Pseudomonas putida]MBF8766339.1 DEAD/DEAH box helicase family protein [Pseudomonas putida]
MSNASNTVVIENNKEALATALELREYASTTRLMSIEGNVLNAVSVAYKTASGLHSANDGQITKSIYSMSKIAIALMIVKADSSDKAFDAAAFEIARDVFVSGKTAEKAQALAEATGRTQEACVSAINSKLEFLTARMNSKTNTLADTGTSTESPEEIRDIILSEGGKYLVSLPTGEGKSTIINEPVLQAYINAGKKVLVISHRRSINKTLANLPGIISYDECNDPRDLQNAKGLKIVVNSLNALKFKRFIESVDLVVIDEASQVISHVLGGEVKNRQSVWETLNFVVKNTANVIMSDADIDARCAEMIGTGYKLFRKPADHAGITVQTGDINHVRALAVASACTTNTLIACDAVKEALALAKSIEKQGGPVALVITADNAQWPEQAAFIANPNETTHQVVIYSPVITSALSITSGHFKAHYGIFQGQVVPSDAIQMLRRDRTAKSFTVGIKQPSYSKSEAVEVSYKCKPVCLDDLLSSITFRYGEQDKEPLVRSALSSLQFQFLEYTHRKDEAWLRDNIQSALPASLISRGFSVEVLEHDDDLSLAGYKSDSLAKKAVKRQIAKGVSQSVSADESTAQRVRDYGSENEQEYLEATRARAIEVMGVSTFSMGDAMVWGHGEGESKVRLYRKLHNHGGALSDLCQTTPSDQDVTVDEISARVMAILKPALIVMAYSDAWTENRSVELFDTLNAIRADVLKAGIRLSAAKSNQAKKADITKIFAQFGLSVKRHETTNKQYFYTIRPKSLIQMTRYI